MKTLFKLLALVFFVSFIATSCSKDELNTEEQNRQHIELQQNLFEVGGDTSSEIDNDRD